VTTEYSVPDVANHVPHMDIHWDAKRVAITPAEASAALRKLKPSIVIGPAESGKGLVMNSFMLQPGEEKIIAVKLSEIFKAHAA
jgi:L-seryl-tRNA(Ser) seleniumtransferase